MRGLSCCASRAPLPLVRLIPQINAQATLHTFSDEEEKAIAEGRRRGMQALLDSPQLSPAAALRWRAGDLLFLCVEAAVPLSADLPRSQHNAHLQGKSMRPQLRRLLQSGTVSVRVVRAEDLGASSLFGRPSM